VGRAWRERPVPREDIHLGRPGKSWTHRADFPLSHARPFVAGEALYVLGHSNDLGIIRSDDWCFAALVAVGPVEHGSRHYASMVIDGDDLHILSRSGDEKAYNAHNGNIITFHTVENFRDLVY